MQIKVILQSVIATGDMYSLVPAMLLEPDLHIIIVHTSDSSSTVIQDFYRQSLGEINYHRQVHHLNYDGVFRKIDCRTTARSALVGKGYLKPQEDLHVTPLPISYGTRYLAAAYRQGAASARHRLSQAWALEQRSSIATIQAWWQSHNVNTGLATVVLWNRYSGTNGGAHPEHDTDIKGQEQLIRLARRKNWQIILTGDSPPLAAEQQEQIQLLLRYPEVIDLTTFWNQTNWPGHSRACQLKTWYCLAKMAPVIHLGMLSGALEPVAMLGGQVVYMINPKCFGSARMKAWENIPELAYRRVELSTPPRAAGKFLVSERSTLNGIKQKQQQTNRFFVEATQLTWRAAARQCRHAAAKLEIITGTLHKQAAKMTTTAAWIALEGFARDYIHSLQALFVDAYAWQSHVVAPLQRGLAIGRDRYRQLQITSSALEETWQKAHASGTLMLPPAVEQKISTYPAGFAEEDLEKVSRELARAAGHLPQMKK